MSACQTDAPVSCPGLSSYEIVQFEPSLYIYKEALGPFMKTAPKVWGELHTILGDGARIGDKKKVMAGLSKCDETKEGDDKFVYQAGLFLKSQLNEPVDGLETREVPGGKFAKFLLTGSYENLPKAYPAATSQVIADGHSLRNDTFFMELYLNTYGTVPNEELLTEIYVPLQ